MQSEMIIFYSWQSDLPNDNNRSLIKSSIEKAVKNLKKKAISISADRDTEGKTGTPDIVETIFNKIDKSDIFIADISTINKDSTTRKTPNPNVLLELGYAAKSIGWERVFCIMNSDYGTYEDIPFDLRTRRIFSYSPSKKDKSDIKNEIAKIIQKMVEALILNDMLPRQNSEIEETKEHLYCILKEGITRAWKSYYNYKIDIDTANADETFADDFLVITDVHFNKAEKIRGYISQEQYFLLQDMLDLLQKMNKGTEDAYSWEHAKIFVKKHFEPIYLEYFTMMKEVDLIYTLKEELIDMFNSLLKKDKRVEYKSSRYSEDGSLVFVCKKYYQEAYDTYGNLLCKVKLDEEGQLSGWKRTDKYAGEYISGKRSGRGIEYSKDYNFSTYIKREGTWKDGLFIDGSVNSVILYSKEGHFTWLSDDELPLSKDCRYIRELFRYEEPGYCRKHYFGDMILKDGEYNIVEGTVKPICSKLGGDVDCYCDECELE